MSKRSGILEFAVLGLLRESPMHGYELRKRLTGLLGPFRAFSYGSLYPTLRRMQADGLIDRRPCGPVPAPVVYVLTPHGQSLQPVAEAIRRWGMAHQDFTPARGKPDIATDARAICGAGITAS